MRIKEGIAVYQLKAIFKGWGTHYKILFQSLLKRHFEIHKNSSAYVWFSNTTLSGRFYMWDLF